MKRQIGKRLCAPHVHDVLEGLCNGTIKAAEAAGKLALSRSRLYALRTDYLLAKASGGLANWMPGVSGGDRAPELPQDVGDFLRRALEAGHSYAFAASEVERVYREKVTRSLVRRWAIAEGLAPEARPPRLPAHTRRWQRTHVGQLWQLDASPHRWFGPDGPLLPLLDMLDDASRLQVGIRLCRGETLADYIDFLRAAFETHGLPLALYVDNAAVFHPRKDGSPSGLGMRLAHYGVSLIFANSPQAKGKVERVHQVWQDRLTSHFRLHGFTPDTDLSILNASIESLALHRNSCETHREIASTPLSAWEAARAAGRSKLRPVPAEGWWPYVWSLWRNVAAGPRGTVHYGALSFPTRLRNGEKAILCEHSCGHHSIIKGLPGSSKHPVLLFSNLPKRLR
jgi:hypothetical protein